MARVGRRQRLVLAGVALGVLAATLTGGSADYAATVRGPGLPAERALEIVKSMLAAGPA